MGTVELSAVADQSNALRNLLTLALYGLEEMSSCSSEDEFESADEGDFGVQDVNRETSNRESPTAKLSSPTVCEPAVDHSISNITTASPSEIQEQESWNILSEPNITDESENIPNIEAVSICTEEITDTNFNGSESDTSSNITGIILEPKLSENSGIVESTESESKEYMQEGNKETFKKRETDQPLENEDSAPIPAEIVTKISTRSISARTRQKSKPTLGAKKLGAVQISQPFPEPDINFHKKTPHEQAKGWAQEPSSSKDTHELTTDKSGWGSWFAPPKSLLSSVSSLTNQIIATVETGLNIPDPEELAKEDMTSQSKGPNPEDANREAVEGIKSTTGFSQLMGGVSNLTRFVESTSNKVLNTGLDTLELLGKKTITVLQQTDPGLKKTKATLISPLQQSNDKPCLSQILREAKEENEGPQAEISDDVSRSVSAHKKSTSLFEDHHGLFHLEALEMLSQQCESRISSQIRRVTAQRKAVLEEITSLCTQVDDDSEENIDPDEFDIESIEQCLTSALDAIGIQLPLKRILEAFRNGFELLTDPSGDSIEMFISDALSSLAQVASLIIELFHKAGELILMADKPVNPQFSGRVEAGAFRSIALLLGREVLRLGGHYANQIIRTEHSSGKSSEYSTEFYFEASNYNSYIQNSLKLLVPILQTRVV